MRRAGALLLSIFCACSELPPGPAPVAQLRQAGATLPSTPHAQGRLSGARLGASVAGCRFPGFVAGAPGEGVALLWRPDAGPVWSGLWFSVLGGDAGSVGVLSACEGTQQNPMTITGGSAGVWEFPGRWLVSSSALSAIASRPNAPGLLLAEEDAGYVSATFPLDSGAWYYESGLTFSPHFGAAVAWHPSGTRFAVSDPDTGTVRVFDATPWNPSTAAAPVELVNQRVVGPLTGGFGQSLLFGDVHPRAGVELLVGDTTSRTVSIYGAGSTGMELLMQVGLMSPGAVGGPMPLALEPASVVAGNLLQAWWVGVPDRNQVWRYIGDAGEPLAPPDAMQFGYSLGTAGGNLLVGAPEYTNGSGEMVGGVFGLPLNTAIVDGGVMQECDVTQVCRTPSCLPGTCYGGVICVPASKFPDCPNQLMCVNGNCVPLVEEDAGVDGGAPDAGSGDAGVVDAGMTDAGTSDAGVADAGSADGGAVDAGLSDGGADPADAGLPPLLFTPSGCSSVGFGPLALAAWLLRRRRGARQFSTTTD